jgi:hypothetical protein
MRVAESGGEAELVAAVDAASGENSYELPRVLPGGTQLLFTVLGTEGVASLDVAVLDLATRAKSIVLESAGFATFAPTGPGPTRGHIVYGGRSALLAAPFDRRTLQVGPTSPVLGDVMGLGPLAVAPGVSDTGTLAYLAGGDVDLGSTLRWTDREGAVQALPEPVHLYGELALSPDGRRVAVSILNVETFETDLWLYELDGDRLTRLTFGGLNAAPVWTPDGERLIHWHAELGDFNDGELRMVPADNSGPPVALVAVQGNAVRPSSISGDGKLLVGTRGLGNGDLWVVPLGESGAAPTDGARPAGGTLAAFLATDFDERDAVLSPDARFLAYSSNESGRAEIYVVPFPGPGGKTQVSTDGGRLPRWNRNGRELFYVSGTWLMAVDVEIAPVFRRLTPKPLLESPSLASPDADFYDVSPDGSRFLLGDLDAGASGQEIELRVVVNWFEELRELAPWPER